MSQVQLPLDMISCCSMCWTSFLHALLKMYMMYIDVLVGINPIESFESLGMIVREMRPARQKRS